jgi:hypothetical protein
MIMITINPKILTVLHRPQSKKLQRQYSHHHLCSEWIEHKYLYNKRRKRMRRKEKEGDNKKKTNYRKEIDRERLKD